MAQIRDIGKRTALYERLSKDDEQQGESNSILNQELLRLDATFFTDKRNRHNTISEVGHVRTLADLISLIHFYHTIAHTNMCLDVLR